MNGTVNSILNWSRLYIPDPKVRTKSVRGVEIGVTSNATGQRQTFFLKNRPISSPSLYVEPHFYFALASLKNSTVNAKAYSYQPATLACLLAKQSENAFTPALYKPVLASYEYKEKVPYLYTDLELQEFLKAGIYYVNNRFGLAYSYTGTISTLVTSATSESDEEILATATAIVALNSYVGEQKRKGLGVNFRGPMSSVDSVQQMKDYQKQIESLENRLADKVNRTDISSQSGSMIDTYTEDTVG